jgi:hypothetical protein
MTEGLASLASASPTMAMGTGARVLVAGGGRPVVRGRRADDGASGPGAKNLRPHENKGVIR